MRYLVAEPWTYRGSMDNTERTVRFVIPEGRWHPIALQVRMPDGVWVGALSMFYGEVSVEVLAESPVRDALAAQFRGEEAALPGPVTLVRSLPGWAREEKRLRRENGK